MKRYRRSQAKWQLILDFDIDGRRGSARLGCGWFLVPFLILTALKLLGWLSWPWPWITMPLWAGPGLFIMMVIGAIQFQWVRDWLHTRRSKG